MPIARFPSLAPAVGGNTPITLKYKNNTATVKKLISAQRSSVFGFSSWEKPICARNPQIVSIAKSIAKPHAKN